MAIRVLWLTKGLGPGGAERLLVETARRIDARRVELTAAYVLPWKDHLTGDLESAGVRTVCLSRRDRDPTWPMRLRNLMAGFDVVHAHSPLPAVAARLAARSLPSTRRPVSMSTEHNTWTSHRRPTRWANQLTGGLDAVTFAVTDETVATMGGPSARRAEVLTHGIDVDEIAGRGAASRARMRSELGIGDDELVIGTVANYRAQKDYPNLLAASRLLADRGRRFSVVAVGQGPLEAAVHERRDQLGLRDRVHLLGFRADSVEVMSACDVFVLASAWEGLPVAVMEALALGLPVVATNVGGMAESLDESCAVLAPPADPTALADALGAVIDDRALRSSLAEGARRAAGRFEVGHAAQRLTECYEQLAGPTRSFDAGPSVPSLAVDRGTPPTTVPDGYRIRPMIESDRASVLGVLVSALGWDDDERAADLYTWKHVDNPFGPSAGWVVVHDDEVVGVRLLMRWRFRRGAVTLRAVRAVDTAIAPEHHGRGLFTALTRTAVEACRSDGVAWVFNTPNEQSRPGYLKLGWRTVGRLPVAVSPTSARASITVAGSRSPAQRWSRPIDVGVEVGAWLADPANGRRLSADREPVSSTDRTIRTDLDENVLRWRYGLPRLHYRVVDDGDTTVIVRLRQRGASRELVVADHLGGTTAADALAARVARDVGATHAIRTGAPDLRHGFLPLPGGGPVLTWRALADPGPPPLPNWDLRLGDVELF